MFKKIVAAIAAIAILIATPAVAGFSNSERQIGIRASHKSLEIQTLGTDRVWVQVEDRNRIQERLANNPDKGRPYGITGVHQGNGNYLIYVQMGFMQLPVGIMTESAVAEVIPVFALLDGVRPPLFLTFVGFEDIWVYLDTTEGQEEYVLGVIRELNQKANDAEGVR